MKQCYVHMTSDQTLPTLLAFVVLILNLWTELTLLLRSLIQTVK